MKTNKLFLRWITVFGFLMIFSISSLAATLPNVDDFNTSIDGWSGTNVSWDSTGKRLFINRDNTASKTYDFGVANANKIISITLMATPISTWESDDKLEVRINNALVVSASMTSAQTYTFTFSAILDANGQVSMTITPNTNDNAEDVYIEKISIAAATAYNGYTSDFTLRKQLYAKGNMKTIGNTVLVAPLNSGATGSAPSDNSNANCSTYTNGAFITDASSTNDQYYLCGYSVDGNQTNATSAELTMASPSSKILWAGLYWQALVADADFSTNMTIKMRREEDNGSSYVSLQPDTLYYTENSLVSNHKSYAAFKDVTSIFLSNNWEDGNYTVAGIPVKEGKISTLGTYGAWSLVVIYEDTSRAAAEKFRSFSVFDGWKQVTNSINAVINVSGFYTPNRSLASSASKVSVFTAEGDKNYAGDQLQTTNYNTNTAVVLPSGSNNTFQSLISGGGLRTPNAINNQGIDIQSFDIGNLLKPKQTDMTFTMTSSLDYYWPSMLAFATELVAPEICYDYSFRQDGAYLKVDNNGSEFPLMTGYISNSPIDTSIYIRSNDADILAQGISFYSDVNDSMFQYVANSTATSNVNGSSLIPRTETTGTCGYTDAATTPIACSNGANIRIGMGKDATGYSQNGGGTLGDKEFAYAKFTMSPIGVAGVEEVNQSLGFKLNYYIIPKTGADPIPYNYEFGTDINLCPPSNGYAPTWGTFNVVESGAATIGGLPVNNLRTKVARNPFSVNIAAYGKNPVTGKYDILPTSNINTTLLVEVIDSGAYHDANATCANPAAVISPTIFVPVSTSNAAPTDPIPVQNAAFHNFAVKNGAFRIWYFDDENQSLIQNWTATTSDTTRLNLTSISGLYRPSYHTLCASACASSTSTTCFNCIKANYARPICSRDNFAVRPESYDLRIYDVNPALTQTNPQKDATKIDLSTQYQYAPMYGSPTGRMNLAAGYNYRFDLNATGNDATLSAVPGYTRNFNGYSADYSATMTWEPQSGHVTSGCNDTGSKNLSFYVANGQLLNSEQNQTQVGDYRLNIIDSSWTGVDWDSALTGHHTTSNGFELTQEDCIIGSDSTTSVNGKIGCVTTSAHSGGGYTYKDHLLTLKPAKFDVNSIVYGLGKIPSLIGSGGNGFVYDSDLGIDNDMAMSVRSSGPIKAVGYGGEALSNFVKDCYATDLNVSISHNASSAYPFSGRMTVAESNGTQMFDSLKFNASGSAVQTIANTYFEKASNGQTFQTIRLNFDRNTTTPIVPQIVHYSDLNVSCTVLSDCNISAAFNGTPNTASGSSLMDFNVTHIYGRIIPRNMRIQLNEPFNATAQYEAYQTPNLVGTPLTLDQFDANWYVNILHNDANYGDSNVTVVDPSVGSSLPTHSNSVNGVETYAFPAFTVKGGYKAHIDTEGWLWYGGVNALPYADPNGPLQAGPDNLDCLTHPCFNLSTMRITGNTGSAKTGVEGQKGNKKTSSTGWSTTSEYAPAVQ